jgi:hypothetical protein
MSVSRERIYTRKIASPFGFCGTKSAKSAPDRIRRARQVGSAGLNESTCSPSSNSLLVTNLGTKQGEIDTNNRDTVQQARRLSAADLQL